ncbi:MAG TPA: hypothetical protein DFR83_17515 [Deltaproteobacteria bacterium]|nr:hypothetical protein [Deltaproteobacteria bacterium]
MISATASKFALSRHRMRTMVPSSMSASTCSGSSGVKRNRPSSACGDKTSPLTSWPSTARTAVPFIEAPKDFVRRTDGAA